MTGGWDDCLLVDHMLHCVDAKTPMIIAILYDFLSSCLFYLFYKF